MGSYQYSGLIVMIILAVFALDYCIRQAVQEIVGLQARQMEKLREEIRQGAVSTIAAQLIAAHLNSDEYQQESQRLAAIAATELDTDADRWEIREAIEKARDSQNPIRTQSNLRRFLSLAIDVHENTLAALNRQSGGKDIA